jgi:hypothetical protein
MLQLRHTSDSTFSDENPINKTPVDSSSKLLEKDDSAVKRLQTKTTDDTSTQVFNRKDQDAGHEAHQAESSGSRISLNGDFQGPMEGYKN